MRHANGLFLFNALKIIKVAFTFIRVNVNAVTWRTFCPRLFWERLNLHSVPVNRPLLSIHIYVICHSLRPDSVRGSGSSRTKFNRPGGADVSFLFLFQILRDSRQLPTLIHCPLQISSLLPNFVKNKIAVLCPLIQFFLRLLFGHRFARGWWTTDGGARLKFFKLFSNMFCSPCNSLVLGHYSATETRKLKCMPCKYTLILTAAPL